MVKRLVIIGASGHGKVIADIAVRNGYEEIVFLDDNESIKECAGFKVVGKTSDASRISGDKIIAIGDAKIRERMMHKVKTVSLIHPDVHIGRGCIINTGASIDHDCNLGNFIHVSVGAHVAGTCSIGNGTWIGAGATISNNINICADCMIGAGAVVIKNIKNIGIYIGVPAEKK